MKIKFTTRELIRKGTRTEFRETSITLNSKTEAQRHSEHFGSMWSMMEMDSSTCWKCGDTVAELVEG